MDLTAGFETGSALSQPLPVGSSALSQGEARAAVSSPRDEAQSLRLSSSEELDVLRLRRSPDAKTVRLLRVVPSGEKRFRGIVSPLRPPGGDSLRGVAAPSVRLFPAGYPFQGTEVSASPDDPPRRVVEQSSRLFPAGYLLQGTEVALQLNPEASLERLIIQSGYRIQFGSRPPRFIGVLPTVVNSEQALVMEQESSILIHSFRSAGNILSEDVTLTFPKNVVQGSVRCSVSVLGDIMGRALKNLDRLLQMPYGCGEQNMIVLAPNIYILLYLEVTGQLTAPIRETATGFLKSGYQRQLNYRHNDGSYSTFGNDESNTWLTAFVMRSFGLARQFIFIDPHVLQSAKDWLISKQGSDGCFIQQGTLYHSEMKGGVGDGVTMTAYIVASLLELGVPTMDPVITNGLSCLRPVVGNLVNTYVTALLAYTFSLAGETTTRSQLLTSLDNLAISNGTNLHWSQTTSGDTLAVEISSYVLLAVLAVQPLTTADLGYANRIVNWLVTQQNPYGGFSSTQDTVVALHALSVYAAQVFSLDGSSSVTVQSSGGDSYSFKVNRDNRLLYQEKRLKNVPGKYTVKVSGSTCVSVQVACFYNIPTPVKSAKTLSVKANVNGDCQQLGANLMLNFTVKYDGVKASTNMVVVDIKLLSGFTADKSLLELFDPIIERVDIEDDHVLVYLKEVPKGVPMSYTLQLNQVLKVNNLKPAVIHVYDYYQTSDSFETTYTSPCP
ncbi:alpha-2-macroglobulin-like protein 1 [Pimephales promelas]|uniref:alpha-2-macroglobulin-like protein 1 n=1 Tax=Pimephales promelas TaxID=90988 RepID=UPI001955E5E3|nr:alpha-2-macroglobulin-like protein 1 [Pimephales promelas]